MASILNRLDHEEVPVTGFSQKLPSLEDVFLTIIDHHKEGRGLNVRD